MFLHVQHDCAHANIYASSECKTMSIWKSPEWYLDVVHMVFSSFRALFEIASGPLEHIVGRREKFCTITRWNPHEWRQWTFFGRIVAPINLIFFLSFHLTSNITRCRQHLSSSIRPNQHNNLSDFVLVLMLLMQSTIIPSPDSIFNNKLVLTRGERSLVVWDKFD